MSGGMGASEGAPCLAVWEHTHAASLGGASCAGKLPQAARRCMCTQLMSACVNVLVCALVCVLHARV